MKIETKFDPEDEVFGIHKEEIVKAKILKVRVLSDFDKQTVDYNIRLDGRKTPFWADESELYPNIDLLLEDMKNKFIENQNK